MGEGQQCHARITDAEVARWEPLIRSLAATRAWNGTTYDHSLYADLCQEARIALLQFIPQQNPCRGELGAFLNVCLRHRMANYLKDYMRQQNMPAYGVRGRASFLVWSFDILDRDQLLCLADDGPQRAAEARAEILLGAIRADLSPCETEALTASLSRELTKNEQHLLSHIREKLRRALGIAESASPSGGRRQTEATKAKIRAKLRGRKIPPEQREKMRLAAGSRRGCKHSEATKRKIGQKALGRKHSEETKQLLRQQALGRTLSPAAKEKARLANIGRKHSDATREKLRLAWRRRREKMRAAAGEQR